ncbi:MAG TPA: 3'-5' exonuclease [Geminicoccaceae bacterium]|nr:3'-5' exonuclease [Geminicoccaceae bacterium]
MSPGGPLAGLRRRWYRRRLQDPAFAFLFEPWDGEEVVALDCETTGLDPARDEILSIAAVAIRGERIRASGALDLLVRPARPSPEAAVLIHHLRAVDVAAGLPPAEAARRVLEFIGPRPLVGYCLHFDLAMLERLVRPLLGVPLPNRRIEVSSLYLAWRRPQLPPGAEIDLGFEAIRRTLDLPPLATHDALDDALLTAMMYLRLQGDWQPRQG